MKVGILMFPRNLSEVLRIILGKIPEHYTQFRSQLEIDYNDSLYSAPESPNGWNRASKND